MRGPKEDADEEGVKGEIKRRTRNRKNTWEKARVHGRFMAEKSPRRGIDFMGLDEMGPLHTATRDQETEIVV